MEADPRSAQTVAEGVSDGGTPDLSIVILTCNQKDLLRDCLRSIREWTHRASFETFVIDSRSTDGTGEMVREQFPDVRYILRHKPFSFTAANNEGIALCRGRYILLLNHDTRLVNDALDRTVAFMDANPTCGVVGCKLLNGDLTLQYSCRRFPSFSAAVFNRYSFLTRVFPGNPFSTNYLMTDFDHDRTVEVDWVSGACMAIRRAALEEVGLLDERINTFTEDVDYCYRMRQHGWSVVYLHDAVVVHYIGLSRSRPFKYFWVHHCSMWYFYRKHYSKSILFIDAAVAVGVFGRAILLGLFQRLRRAT